MRNHITQSICDMNRNRLCDLYDSKANPEGQATDIKVTSEQNGWKEINFTQPRKVNGEVNHRWAFIRSEYLIKYTKDDFVDWYVIHTPNKQRSGLAATNAVKCSHLSSQQNKRNLYFEFDDENGIGTIDHLVRQALTGTGWSLGLCDTFFEADGATEKVRSMSTNGKRGAYLLIQDICKLFHARPVYHGDTRTVDIRALEARDGLLELNYGKNLKSLDRKENSENIVTRLYVEGEYGDYGYVGIDEVNPTGLSFLLDFSYYKQLGSFTDAHQAALDKYLLDIRREKVTASEIMEQVIERESRLNSLWGQYNYMLYVVEGGTIARSLSGGTVADDKRELQAGDSIVVLLSNGTHEYREYVEGMSLSGITYIVKYITKPAGIIGGKEVAIESKEQSIVSLSKLRDKATTDAKRDEYQRQIDDLRTGIALLMSGAENGSGLYSLMREAVGLVVEMADRNRVYEASLGRQNEIEAEFAVVMGDMLRDGYYSDSNYTIGQEEFLYRDALDMMAVLARPEVKYSVAALNLSHLAGYEQEQFQLNMALRLYDDELDINDYVYITKLDEYPATPWTDTITISNDAQEIGNKTLESILTRINEIAALIEQKQALYERARAIGADGSIPLKRLEGTIDVQKTRLTSAVSNWYTDDSGNLILESLDGRYAMKLCGEGFMIAAGRNDQGNWDWRTFGTGEGFTADLIVAGYLSADRIEAESITVNKLASDVGRSLDLSSNTSISLAVSNTVKEAIGYRVDIEADRGTVLSEYVPTLTLSARVWNGNEDVTAKIPASRFIWTRKSVDPTGDAQWNQAHIAVKSVTVTTMDVYLSATFECAVQDA